MPTKPRSGLAGRAHPSGRGAAARPPRRPAQGPVEDVLRAAIAVHRHLDLDQQLAEVARWAADWTGALGAVAFAPDSEGRGLVPLAESRGLPGALLDRMKEVAATLTLTEAARHEGTADGLGPFGNLRSRRKDDPTTSRIYLMRRPDERVVAVVVVLDPKDGEDPRIEALEIEARTALGNAAHVGAIRELTIRDDTADCFNRRYFDEFLVEEIARASRFKTPLSLIFFDMDNLKEVNSRLGHAMGSRSLLEVSQRVRGRIRKFDKLFRFGGDEFCIVLPETEWHGALEVAERVREAISTRPMLCRELGEKNGQGMTASFGVASFPLHARSKEEIVVRADRAMQSIKNTRKNGIAVAELESHGVR